MSFFKKISSHHGSSSTTPTPSAPPTNGGSVSSPPPPPPPPPMGSSIPPPPPPPASTNNNSSQKNKSSGATGGSLPFLAEINARRREDHVVDKVDNNFSAANAAGSGSASSSNGGNRVPSAPKIPLMVPIGNTKSSGIKNVARMPSAIPIKSSPQVPPPPPMMSSPSVPPPPPMMSSPSVPPPPPMMSSPSVPPPPPMMSSPSVPPPPPMMSSPAVPPPPPMMSSPSVPPPPPMMSSPAVPPPQTASIQNSSKGSKTIGSQPMAGGLPFLAEINAKRREDFVIDDSSAKKNPAFSDANSGNHNKGSNRSKPSTSAPPPMSFVQKIPKAAIPSAPALPKMSAPSVPSLPGISAPPAPKPPKTRPVSLAKPNALQTSTPVAGGLPFLAEIDAMRKDDYNIDPIPVISEKPGSKKSSVGNLAMPNMAAPPLPKIHSPPIPASNSMRSEQSFPSLPMAAPPPVPPTLAPSIPAPPATNNSSSYSSKPISKSSSPSSRQVSSPVNGGLPFLAEIDARRNDEYIIENVSGQGNASTHLNKASSKMPQIFKTFANQKNNAPPIPISQAPPVPSAPPPPPASQIEFKKPSNSSPRNNLMSGGLPFLSEINARKNDSHIVSAKPSLNFSPVSSVPPPPPPSLGAPPLPTSPPSPSLQKPVESGRIPNSSQYIGDNIGLPPQKAFPAPSAPKQTAPKPPSFSHQPPPPPPSASTKFASSNGDSGPISQQSSSTTSKKNDFSGIRDRRNAKSQFLPDKPDGDVSNRSQNGAEIVVPHIDGMNDPRFGFSNASNIPLPRKFSNLIKFYPSTA